MTATIEVALAGARFVQFVAAMAVLGTSLFPFYALPQCAAGATQIASETTAAARLTLLVASIAAALAALAWAVVTIAGITGDLSEIVDPEILSAFFFSTSFGGAWMLRLVVAAALVVTVLLQRTRLFAPNAASGIVAALAAGLLASQAWIGHPAALSDPLRPIVIAAHAIHVLAAGIWIGGLLPLGFVLAGARHAASGPAIDVAARALRRFSAVGMVAIVVLLCGGLIDAYSRLHSLSAFATSAWAQVLACKIALFLALVTGASVNRFLLMPRLSARPTATLASLARGIAFEQVLGLLALAAAAWLGILAPPA